MIYYTCMMKQFECFVHLMYHYRGFMDILENIQIIMDI